MLAVSIDADDGAYHKFLKDYSVSMVTVRDEAKKASTLYGTFGWPESYIIDRDGIIRRKFIGAGRLDQPGDYRLSEQALKYFQSFYLKRARLWRTDCRRGAGVLFWRLAMERIYGANRKMVLGWRSCIGRPACDRRHLHYWMASIYRA